MCIIILYKINQNGFGVAEDNGIEPFNVVFVCLLNLSTMTPRWHY